MNGRGHKIGPRTVSKLLREDGYSLQRNRKTKEGTEHPDRNRQFEYINARPVRFMKSNRPVISIDTKKKEIAGNFTNKGEERRPKRNPVKASVHDFMDTEPGKAIPFGACDIKKNEGRASVGIDHDTAQFACEAVWRWRQICRGKFREQAVWTGKKDIDYG
jgi:hypothetical protein